MIPVILSGGSGSRLWPLSRRAYPKHLIDLVGEQSLFQKTIERVLALNMAKPLLICNQDHRFLIAEQMREMGQDPEAIILEPCGRNTAPAITIAALQANPDDILLILPADHLIQDQAAFEQAVAQAIPFAESGQIVTFGIVPTSAHTGYGYIKRGERLDQGYIVDQFIEKPDQATANAYVDSGDYYWNAGMFCVQAKAYLDAIERFHPDMLKHAQQALTQAEQDLDFLRLEEAAFSQCEDISVDYAVMEKTEQAIVVPMDAKWTDLGSWDAIDEVTEKDADGNVLIGDVLTTNTSNSYIRSDGHLVAAVGVKDHIIVDTADAIMVAHKSETQAVKKIVEQLKKSGREERLHHLIEYRPWGSHELLIEGGHFQVRRVRIKPGMAIADQIHRRRSEHWVVVSGQADVTCGDVSRQLTENESFYVPVGARHRIRNVGDAKLEFIEVQVGDCLKDDDIERV